MEDRANEEIHAAGDGAPAAKRRKLARVESVEETTRTTPRISFEDMPPEVAQRISDNLTLADAHQLRLVSHTIACICFRDNQAEWRDGTWVERRLFLKNDYFEIIEEARSAQAATMASCTTVPLLKWKLNIRTELSSPFFRPVFGAEHFTPRRSRPYLPINPVMFVDALVACSSMFKTLCGDNWNTELSAASDEDLLRLFVARLRIPDPVLFKRERMQPLLQFIELVDMWDQALPLSARKDPAFLRDDFGTLINLERKAYTYAMRCFLSSDNPARARQMLDVFDADGRITEFAIDEKVPQCDIGDCIPDTMLEELGELTERVTFYVAGHTHKRLAFSKGLRDARARVEKTLEAPGSESEWYVEAYRAGRVAAEDPRFEYEFGRFTFCEFKTTGSLLQTFDDFTVGRFVPYEMRYFTMLPCSRNDRISSGAGYRCPCRWGDLSLSHVLESIGVKPPGYLATLPEDDALWYNALLGFQEGNVVPCVDPDITIIRATIGSRMRQRDDLVRWLMPALAEPSQGGVAGLARIRLRTVPLGDIQSAYRPVNRFRKYVHDMDKYHLVLPAIPPTIGDTGIPLKEVNAEFMILGRFPESVSRLREDTHGKLWDLIKSNISYFFFPPKSKAVYPPAYTIAFADDAFAASDVDFRDHGEHARYMDAIATLVHRCTPDDPIVLRVIKSLCTIQCCTLITGRSLVLRLPLWAARALLSNMEKEKRVWIEESLLTDDAWLFNVHVLEKAIRERYTWRKFVGSWHAWMPMLAVGNDIPHPDIPHEEWLPRIIETWAFFAGKQFIRPMVAWNLIGEASKKFHCSD